MGVQYVREDRGEETEFVTISYYWESIEAMSRFAGVDETRIHHLDRDREFPIELPSASGPRNSHGNTGGAKSKRRRNSHAHQHHPASPRAPRDA
jgi:hypothetical protein